MSEPPAAAEPRALPPGQPGAALVGSPAPAFAFPQEPARVYALPSGEEPHLWDYWRVIARHRWTVITFFLVSVITATIWTFTARPVFIATATLRIEKEEPRVLKFEEVVKADPQQDYYQTQYKLLQTRSLASRVIGLLQLDRHPEFQQAEPEAGWFSTAQVWARDRLVRWVSVPAPPAPAASEDVAPESLLTRAFAARLSVQPERNTRLVKVSFESFYPDLAARIANTLAEAFIAQHLDQKVETTRYASQFLAKHLDEAREKLGVAEERLAHFLERNDILFIAPEKVGERQDLITQQLVILSDSFLKARGERVAKESLVTEALRQEPDSVPAVLHSALVAKLKEELATLQGEYRKLGQTFRPDYPRMQRLQQNISEVHRQLREEIRRVIEALETEYRTAVRNEQESEKALVEQRNVARRLGAQLAEHNLLRRDVDAGRELYTSLLSRLKETQISSALLTSNISIVDRAEVPLAATKPRRGMNLLIATMIGIFGGLGLAFFFEHLDRNIKDAREVEGLLGVPTLGVVPSQRAVEGRRRRRSREFLEDEEEVSPFALVAHTQTGSVLAEAFRTLRLSLLYSAPDHPPKSLMVTSLHAGDGKTSLATNIAITLAQLGAGEVLLVDGDMRRPNLHELLSLPQAPGLSAFLTGQVELPAVVKATRIPNLYAIPSGRIPLTPAELFASVRLRQALDVLGERFRHIIFDSPPLLGVSDSLTLAPRVEGVLLVLRHGQASRDGAYRAIHLLRSVHARLLGVILNLVDVRGGSGYGYYGYYGYHRYGYGYGDRTQDD